MREAKIQQLFKQHCLQRKVLCYKIDSTSTRGIPDLICILPNGEVIFVELKTETGRLSKLQEYNINNLRKNNANVHVVRSVEEGKKLIDSYLKE